ncbi:MAG: hypothetical protein QOH48_988 [Actinomycetota bacterium]|nr:hypothetical protein [Actinomycetota bacterium]
MSTRHRLVLVLVASFAFGLFAAWAKGQNTDALGFISQIRSDLGNLSTPWLLVPFAAGVMFPQRWSSVVVGLAATATALVAFYLLTTLVIDLGGHGFLADFRLELMANRYYLEGGVVTGPLFGAVGGWWKRSASLPALLLIGILLIAEPLVLLGMDALGAIGLTTAAHLPGPLRVLPGWQLSFNSGAVTLSVYGGELLVGAALVAVAMVPRLSSRSGLTARTS